MTWREFKEEIDRQLKEMESSEDVEIWYIDCHPGLFEKPNVQVEEVFGMSVS